MNFGATLINPTTLLNPSAKGADEFRNHRELGRRLGRPNDPRTFGQMARLR